MKYANADQEKFLLDMSERQISALEFFANVLVSLNKDLGLNKVLISYFDTRGSFLSWLSLDGALVNSENHPYRKFAGTDVIRELIFQDAVRDHLTYFNLTPRLYKSTDIIGSGEYDHSAYARFLEENFQQHYSVAMAFGINAYIQVNFFKSQTEGDFTPEEIASLKKLYVYIANSYKNFKKHEQSKIVSKIQREIISSGEKAYLVTDSFTHVLSYNKLAQTHLEEIFGPSVAEQINSESPCSWLLFILGADEDSLLEDYVQTREFKNFVFKIHTYDQTYSNGIIDRYHWIAISKTEENSFPDYEGSGLPLTPAEQKVAELMYAGLTYREIADKLVVSYHTVKKHVQNIYAKCGVKSRYQLYKWLEEREK